MGNDYLYSFMLEGEQRKNIFNPLIKVGQASNTVIKVGLAGTIEKHIIVKILLNWSPLNGGLNMPGTMIPDLNFKEITQYAGDYDSIFEFQRQISCSQAGQQQVESF